MYIFAGIDRRKTNVIRKRKIGIQIRYDYTKPNDKSLNNSSVREDVRTIKTYDLSKDDLEHSEQTSDSSTRNNSEEIIDVNFTKNTQEIYSIIGIPEKKNQTPLESQTDEKG